MPGPRQQPDRALTGDASPTGRSGPGGRPTRRRRGASPSAAQVETLISRGYAFIAVNNWEHAIEAFSAAVDVAPNSVEARMCRSIAYIHRGGDYNLAIADVDVALAQMTDPAQRRRAYQCRAVAHERADQLEMAISDCEAGLALAPDDADLGHIRARLLVLLGRCGEAVESLTSALELHRGDLDSLYLRAAAYAGEGEVAAARQDILKACGLEAARRTANGGRCRPRGDHDLQAQMAVVWATLLGHPGQRITACGTVPSADGEGTAGLAAALLNRAAVYLMLGQNERRALLDLDEAARLEPNCMAVLMTRATVNAMLGRHDEVLRDAAGAISGQTEPADDDFVRALGRARRGEDLPAVLAYLDGAADSPAKRA